jgi:hypothetical protein
MLLLFFCTVLLYKLPNKTNHAIQSTLRMIGTGQNRCYRVHIGYISGTRYVSDMCEICV